MPACGYVDLRREWAIYGATDESYRESQTVMEYPDVWRHVFEFDPHQQGELREGKMPYHA